MTVGFTTGIGTAAGSFKSSCVTYSHSANRLRERLECNGNECCNGPNNLENKLNACRHAHN